MVNTPLIAFAAELKEGVGIQSLLTFSVGFIPLLIFIGSFLNKKSEWKLTHLDLLCCILSIIGLVLWQVTKVGNLAIAFSILSDGFAALPTIIKSFHFPETESAWPWLTASISGFTTVLTINQWNFTNYGFPIYIFIVNLIIFLLVQLKIGRTFTKTH